MRRVRVGSRVENRRQGGGDIGRDRGLCPEVVMVGVAGVCGGGEGDGGGGSRCRMRYVSDRAGVPVSGLQEID